MQTQESGGANSRPRQCKIKRPMSQNQEPSGVRLRAKCYKIKRQVIYNPSQLLSMHSQNVVMVRILEGAVTLA